ncbi:uncharacterized protein Z520_10380 [Fonsecaea multimorphosa CBS 102226]|uniref:FAR-17a/AIG1-like protein n=1 Tax=Fonsecaea multimorphosa CBS 102226 TaxID=1442371 RepID=A0A0D2KBL2_9EURO|nr:uncharacterized protein Z520_10380 [Fonsecaea multimorphosa CBS 102226]KIX94043.1 hypothetical protein Z520_10380 [Fonsecaea multimorphosa CBS 102226]OAL19389.1 hypothetical protein AYO22_09933 [Fonsecaea multimorphosa]
MAPDLQRSKTPRMDTLIRRHPLQKLQSPSRGVSALLHSAGLASFSYSFNWLSTHPNHINRAYGWHFQYLTIIGLTLATATFILGLLADLTLSPRLFAAKNVLSMCSAPMEVLVSTLYWGLRAIDPQLVVPKELELPLPADVSFHLTPSALLLVDLLLFSPPWTITVLPAILLSTVIAFLYWFWIELCYSYNGFYPYPLFGMLDQTQRAGLFGLSAVVMAGNTVMLKWLYSYLHGFQKTGSERPGKVKN